jgi:hypothetical protein
MPGLSQIGSKATISTQPDPNTVTGNRSEQFRSRPETIGGQPVPRNPQKVRSEGSQQIPVPSALKRRAGSCLIGIPVGVVVVGKLLDWVVSKLAHKVGLGKLKPEKFCNWVTRRKPVPQQKLTFLMPGTNSETVELNSSILPKRMPKSMTIEQLTAKIQNKINSGYELLQAIHSDSLNGSHCTVEDMTNIMFFLQAKGEAKVGNFSQGSFSIPDPDNKIRDFLDTCKQAYQRTSSHVNDFQKMAGGKHRGIDAYGSNKHSDTLLPHGMKTLLYGTMTQNEEMQMPANRLWLKIESHGAWLTSPKGSRDVPGPGRTMNRHDTMAMAGHSVSFLETRGKGSLAGSFKERIPSSVKNDYRAMLELAPTEIQDILNKNNPTGKAMGIRVMVRNVENALEQVPLDKPELSKSMMNFLDTIHRNYSDLDIRIGNEVILSDSELHSDSSGISSTGNDVQPDNDSLEIFETILQPQIDTILQQKIDVEEKVSQLLTLNDSVQEMGLDTEVNNQVIELIRKEVNTLLDAQEIEGSGIRETIPFVLPETLSIEDIQQSPEYNDCYILSTIGAVLNTDWGAETLKGMMVDNGDSVTVRFKDGSVTVNKEGLVNRKHPAPPWVQVFDKACTEYLDRDISRLGSLDEIPDAFGWNGSDVPSLEEIDNIVSIQQQEQLGMMQDLLRDQLSTALEEGRAVTFMRNGHAVALTEIDQEGTFHFHNSLVQGNRETQTLEWVAQTVLNGRGQFYNIQQP